MYRLPGYNLGEEIARTDRAIVYNAVKASTREQVAAKLVPNDAAGDHETRMLRRVLMSSAAGPSHVVHLLDTYKNADVLWLVLEYFDSTLERLHAPHMTPLALKSIALDSAKGLVEMDRAGIVDDDVKPGNIALKLGSGRAAHIDLEFARLIGSRPSGYTPNFGAPEIERKIPSNTSPCYGWARSLEEIVAGRSGLGPRYLLSDYVPWVGREFSKLVAQCCYDDPHRRPSVPELYERVKYEVQHKVRCPRCKAVKFRDGSCVNCG